MSIMCNLYTIKQFNIGEFKCNSVVVMVKIHMEILVFMLYIDVYLLLQHIYALCFFFNYYSFVHSSISSGTEILRVVICKVL